MSKICNTCGTENSDEYNFCKQCGTSLAEKEPVINNYNPNTAYGCHPPIEEIEGVSYKEMSVFVGKNSYKIVDKFIKMKLADSKISWCWPVAVLSFFFGFFGAAIWFFYRKMNKLALILVALGLVFDLAGMALTFNTTVDLMDSTYGLINEIAETGEISASFTDYLSLIEGASENGNTAMSNLLSDIEKGLSVIGLGMFSLYFYKKHTFAKINAVKQLAPEENIYYYTLAARGGTSSGMVALGVVLMIVLSGIVGTIPQIAYFFIK